MATLRTVISVSIKDNIPKDIVAKSNIASADGLKEETTMTETIPEVVIIKDTIVIIKDTTATIKDTAVIIKDKDTTAIIKATAVMIARVTAVAMTVIKEKVKTAEKETTGIDNIDNIYNQTLKSFK